MCVRVWKPVQLGRVCGAACGKRCGRLRAGAGKLLNHPKMEKLTTIKPLPPSSHGKPADSFAQAAGLERALKRMVRGEVRFDAGSRAMYASDGSNYRQIPIGLVVPRDAEDVAAAVEACRKFGAPVLPRGAGTSLAGQSCNVAVVLDFTKYMNRIVELDAEGQFARVEPGVVLDTLRGQAENHQLTFAPDPSTHSRCTIGGMIGNNSCGTHSLLGGKTVDNVEELTVLLYDGTRMTVGASPEADLEGIAREEGRRGQVYAALRRIRDQYAELVRAKYPRIPRRVSGYNLDELLPENGFHVARALVGTEGTCAVVLEAKLKLIHSPQERVLVGLGYPDAYQAADHVPEILQFDPIGLEGLEGGIIDGLAKKKAANLELLPEGRGLLLVEFGTDDAAESAEIARRMVERVGRLPGAPMSRTYTKTEARAVWQLREAGPRASAFYPGAPAQWDGWDDSAVAPQKLGRYLRELRALLDSFGYVGAFYGHFGHGCVHLRVSFDLLSEGGIRKFLEYMERAADLVISYGGSLSGEHGDGQSRAELLPKMFGPELVRAFGEFKAAWDPANGMNPHKVVDPYPMAENLRLGTDYRPIRPATYFQYPEDDGSFVKASERCIGLGMCRKQDAGGMCPSYMVTLEEEHSTRGRARMLFELLQGEVIRAGWKDEQVKQALELCLACKACKSECPANVDLATYKAEFLAHYYEGRGRPLFARVFGNVDRWLHLAAAAPRAANFVAHTPGLRGVLRGLLGLASEREIPRIARRSFMDWARGSGELEGRADGASREVVLWVDTFNNYFHPETLRAGLEVLRAAGFRVTIGPKQACCGRPLYDFGMLREAREYLEQVLRVLAPQIERGVPIVVLEPSCASVFRDELRNLMADDARAGRLANQTFLLSEFLERHAAEWKAPRLERKVILQGHCHQKALMKMGHAELLLRRMGAEVESLDAGCCGMAGPFGFAREKYAVSMAVGERVLLPAVRSAAEGTVIVADGFSCREQIRQGTGRKAVHLAEAIQAVLGNG